MPAATSSQASSPVNASAAPPATDAAASAMDPTGGSSLVTIGRLAEAACTTDPRAVGSPSSRARIRTPLEPVRRDVLGSAARTAAAVSPSAATSAVGADLASPLVIEDG